MSFIMRLFILVMFLCASSLFASIGKVSLLKGEASLERAGQKLSLKNGIGIEEKDTIRTSKDAQIQLIFEDKTVITLGSESEFKVEEYLSETTKPKAKFKFNQGVFKTITGQIGKTAPENFTLETKTATIGIRGTVIGGVVPPPSSSAPDTIFCLGGKITATSRQTGITVNLPTGTMTVVPLNAPPAPPRQTTPQDIQQFNQSLGTPPPPAPAEGSNPPPAQSSGSSGGESGSNSNSSTQGNSESGNSGTSAAPSSGNNAPTTSMPMSMDETPTAPPPTSIPFIAQTQTAVPTAATTALQTNLQTLAQEVVVEDVAEGLGVPVEEIQQQITSGSPITPPTDSIAPPPIVPPTNPVVPPTDPITPPPTPTTVPITPPADPVIPPPTDPIIPPPADPVTPPPSGDSGEVVQTCPGGTSGTYPNCVTLTCPSGTSGTYPDCVDIPTASYTTLFSNMSALEGASETVLFPDEKEKSMVFDATNGLWKSSDNAYIVTSTDGNFSYINELSGTQTMYVKDLTQSYNPVLFKSFPTDSNASGYLSGVSGLNPIASTHYELVTGVKSVMNEYSYAIKYEQGSSYDARKWEYDSGLKLFTESYHHADSEISWEYINNFASLYSDISNPDTAYQSSLIGAISNYQLFPYINFYIHGVPDANQSLKNYGILADGGKWYFTYDKTNPNFSTTVNVYGDLPITDAIITSSDYIPFMHTTKGYPIYVVDHSGSKEMYSIKNFNSIANDMYNWVNNHFLEINTDYVTVDESNIVYFHALQENQQNVYLFYKIDENGTLIEDSRNGKVVNPITGNALNLYTNYHLELSEIQNSGAYVFGPINNPLLDNDTLPTPQTADNTMSYEDITTLPLNIYSEGAGADFRKLAIEKASWNDKPSDDSIYVYSDYGSNSNNRDFSDTSKTETFIKFPTDGNGIMMNTHFNVVQERNATSDVVKNYFTGSVTTGRIVENETDGSNKMIFKHFDTINGVITSDSTSSYDTTHNMYFFNEKDQFVNADNGGLDNYKEDIESKYNWLVHEEVNATTSEVAGVDLMKKVTDSSDTSLFTSYFDYNTSFATGSMSGFMIGEDTSINVWMGDISAFDTNASGGRGLLTITSAANDLNITTPISMDGLTQTDASETIPSASFLGEDMQAMIIEGKTINGKTYDFAMATLPDTVVDEKYSYQNDYTSWGYWVATEKAPTAGGSYAQGYWVAGYETPVGSMPIAETIYNYNGHVLGTLTNGTLASPIKLDEYNSFKANIEFGAANPVTVTEIKFNTMDLGSVYIAEPLVTSTSTISGNTFSGSAADGSTALDLKGKFFGPNAEAIGGAWKGTFNSNTLSGTGVFKAIKGTQAP